MSGTTELKLQHIIDMTEEKIGKINFEEIKEALKNLPDGNKDYIETAVRERNVEDIGKFILMSIYQVTQDKVKEAVYQ